MNHNTQIRKFSLMMALLLVAGSASTLLSCGGDEPAADDGKTTNAPIVTEAVTEDPGPKLELPEADYGGRNFNMLIPTEYTDHYVAESETGDVVLDAIYKRNRAVEELYNVDIVGYKIEGGRNVQKLEKLTASILAGDKEFDVAYIPGQLSSIIFNQPDYVIPLSDIDTLDLSHSWWDKGSVEAMTIKGSTISATGDMIVSTMGEYDFCVNMCLERTGKPAFDRGRLNWICRVIRNQLIRIERFKYDLPGKFMTGVRVYRNAAGELTVLADGLRLHRGGRILGSAGHTEEEGSFIARITETEDAVTGYPSLDGIVQKETVTLSKKDWQLWLTEEDCFPRIHIPSDGGFDKKTIAHAYARAREVFDRCYPDYPYKGFFCSSWLMSTDLKEVLKPTSNILGFQEPFTQIPHLSSGRLVFSFVFGLSAAIPEDIDALPEKSSLQRAVKERYKAGGFIHEGAGFFL